MPSSRNTGVRWRGWVSRSHECEDGGAANGRALAYLAHAYLGEAFGTAYDVSTITILWFAGASAMAGLLNLVPRYFLRYGVAPEWTRARRPLVLIFTLITCLVTWLFDADVEAQGGAYATGVLVLMTSASLAVTLAAWRQRCRVGVYSFITLVFVYTTTANVIERPEGIKIAAWFIATIILTSLISRVLRSTELRVEGVVTDGAAQRFIDAVAHRGQIRILANRPDTGEPKEYEGTLREMRAAHHHLPTDAPVLFLEVTPGDASDFSERLHVEGHEVHGYHVLRCTSPAIPNAIAALLIHIRAAPGSYPMPTSAGRRAIR